MLPTILGPQESAFEAQNEGNHKETQGSMLVDGSIRFASLNEGYKELNRLRAWFGQVRQWSRAGQAPERLGKKMIRLMGVCFFIDPQTWLTPPKWSQMLPFPFLSAPTFWLFFQSTPNGCVVFRVGHPRNGGGPFGLRREDSQKTTTDPKQVHDKGLQANAYWLFARNVEDTSTWTLKLP